MRYATAAAFRKALEQRLRDRAQSARLPLDVLRKRVVFERFLARLVRVSPDDWRLKGALALEFRLRDHARFTRDLDLVHEADEEHAEEGLRAAAQQDLEDHFVFEVSRIGTLQPEETGERHVVRYRLRVTLAGRLFEEVRLDVGFLDPLQWQPEILRGSDLLAFADIEPVEVPGLPLPQHVAEKVHALTRVYEGGRSSSRVKDLVDVALISTFSGLDAAALRAAIEATFRARGTHPIPETLTDPPEDWSRSYAEMAEQVGLEPDLAAGHTQGAKFLDPILQGRSHGRWDPERQAWSQ